MDYATSSGILSHTHPRQGCIKLDHFVFHFVHHFVRFRPFLDKVEDKVKDKVGPNGSLMQPCAN